MKAYPAKRRPRYRFVGSEFPVRVGGVTGSQGGVAG
jgi:hypothetical protein